MSEQSALTKSYRPEIRFVDIDAYGIVHNATYLVYLEQARIHWWRQVVREAWDWTQIGVLVAHHDIDYVAPVRLGDALEIACSVGEIGDKSIEQVRVELRRQAGCESQDSPRLFRSRQKSHDDGATGLARRLRRGHFLMTQTRCSHDVISRPG